MYGSDEWPAESGPTVEAAGSSSHSTPEKPTVTTSGEKNADGQTVYKGKFEPRKWFDGPGTELVDTLNSKGYETSMLKMAVAKADDKLVSNSKNKVDDAVPADCRIKFVDTFGTHASVALFSCVREVASIGHIRVLVEKGFPKAYPVR